MKRGYFKVSHELLVQALHLPENAEIIAVDFHSPNTCKVWVEHPDIPDVELAELREYPELCPTFHTQDEIVEFVGWGIEE